jgi:hypothetical protein
MLQNKKDLVYILLAGFFITNAVMGEMIGGKLIQVGPYTFSAGLIPWPVVFLTTDLINEYFGKKGVRRLTFITAGLILYAFLLIFMGMQFDAVLYSPVDNENFNKVFGQSMWIIIGSMTAFRTSQLVDVVIFVFIRNKTGPKKLWLRATGSTVISQLIDTFIVVGIAFWLPGKISFAEYLETSVGGYTSKLIIAIALTPVIYFAHYIIDRYFAPDLSGEAKV